MQAPPHNWQIGAYVDRGDNARINAYAREELKRGAEALLFRLYRQPDADDIAVILKDIPVDRVSLHCALRYPGQDPAELFRDLVTSLRRSGTDLSKVSGSVDFDPLLDWSDPPFPPLVRLLFFVNRWMPGFRVLQVNAAGFDHGPDRAATEIALALAKGREYLRQVDAHGYPAALVNDHLQFAVTVGNDAATDAAKIICLRQLWKEVLAELGIDGDGRTVIAAHTDVTTMTGDQDENHQRLRQQAEAAIRGGADIVFLAPAEGLDQPPTPVGRQMSLAVLTDARTAPKPEPVDRMLIDRLTREAREAYGNLQTQGGFAEAQEF